jgi:Domain of unknown function (DUF4394)
MPRRIVTALLAAALLVIALVPVVNASNGGKHKRDRDCGQRWKGHSHHKRGLDVVGLTDDGRLICFSEKDPRDARTIGRVKGLMGDDKLVGIDYRPATGDLYGLGNKGGVYVLDDHSGRASLKSNLNVPLAGTSFGVDFNPVVDRLRIVSDTGQNLADNVDANNDTVTDGTLTNAGPVGSPPPTALGVAGAAYTNNDADPNTGTTLFDIDSTLDQVSIQSRPASGQLAATGKLGVDTGPAVGSDIYSTIRGGTTVRVQGFASLTVNGRSGFYGVNLLQGRADSRGSFSSRNAVTGIAVPLNQR